MGGVLKGINDFGIGLANPELTAQMQLAQQQSLARQQQQAQQRNSLLDFLQSSGSQFTPEQLSSLQQLPLGSISSAVGTVRAGKKRRAAAAQKDKLRGPAKALTQNIEDPNVRAFAEAQLQVDPKGAGITSLTASRRQETDQKRAQEQQIKRIKANRKQLKDIKPAKQALSAVAALQQSPLTVEELQNLSPKKLAAIANITKGEAVQLRNALLNVKNQFTSETRDISNLFLGEDLTKEELLNRLPESLATPEALSQQRDIEIQRQTLQELEQATLGGKPKFKITPAQRSALKEKGFTDKDIEEQLKRR